MEAQPSQSGSILLQLIVIILVAASGFVFLQAWRSSTRVDDNEAAAQNILRQLHAAQTELLADSGNFGTILRLLDFEGASTATAERRALKEKIKNAAFHGGVFAQDGYCFLILMADQKGQETLVETANLKPDFFVAYAWPLDFGSSGRRVFVIDPSGILRGWENRLPADYSYSGPETPPPGHLAPSPEGHPDYPFILKRQGPQKTLQWQVLGSDRP